MKEVLASGFKDFLNLNLSSQLERSEERQFKLSGRRGRRAAREIGNSRWEIGCARPL